MLAIKHSYEAILKWIHRFSKLLSFIFVLIRRVYVDEYTIRIGSFIIVYRL